MRTTSITKSEQGNQMKIRDRLGEETNTEGGRIIKRKTQGQSEELLQLFVRLCLVCLEMTKVLEILQRGEESRRSMKIENGTWKGKIKKCTPMDMT